MDSKTLRSIQIFAALDDNELAQMSNITKEKRFQSGETIMQEGLEGDTMYLVIDGEVEVSKVLTLKFGDDDYRETEKVMRRVRPENHEVFGEMALIAREKRSASITAVTDCVLLEINRDDFFSLIEDLPGLGVKVLVKISELLISRLRRASQDVIRLTTALSIALSK
jgi:CRP-like cAMP-binding protein